MKFFPVFTNRDPIPQDYTVGLLALEANSPGFKKSHPTLPKSISSIFTMAVNSRSTRSTSEITETVGSLTGDNSTNALQIVKSKVPVDAHSSSSFLPKSKADGKADSKGAAKKGVSSKKSKTTQESIPELVADDHEEKAAEPKAKSQRRKESRAMATSKKDKPKVVRPRSDQASLPKRLNPGTHYLTNIYQAKLLNWGGWDLMYAKPAAVITTLQLFIPPEANVHWDTPGAYQCDLRRECKTKCETL